MIKNPVTRKKVWDNPKACDSQSENAENKPSRKTYIQRKELIVVRLHSFVALAQKFNNSRFVVLAKTPIKENDGTKKFIKKIKS